ncbi:GatB/YqeY domain-containing protein [Pseudohongiella sp. SYSU M77423]|uniref:GatB/YqeY domain-containing protein n=1 Tax=Pseudohongiella sp. SYSU M77423 TaxID=3042312 RepID=UPI00247FAFEA|nr:GatB/YqeY domain-containing protein [Pseudohongiella sp. SYSU M77423]MDH7943865.1 GatB/YqeY domain-containing protein [Pseudohongiella sp. SYSU M77423]MEC8860825.1 GatB/YqeY domain-containing protein [Pseudomonadota bacterium]
MADCALKNQLTEAMKDAMRAKDKARLGTIRLALAEVKKVEVDERIEPDDARVLSLLEKMIKQRKESIRQYEAAGRTDLADTEQAEIDVLQTFMPAALSEQEVDAIITQAMADTDAKTMQDMGKVMAAVKPQVAGRADMAAISQTIKSRLSNA